MTDESNVATLDENETPESSTESSGLDVVTESYTYAIYRSPAKEGSDKPGELGWGLYKEVKSADGKLTGNSLALEISEGKKELLQKVEVSIPMPHTFNGIKEVVPDEDEAILIFCKGAMSKVITRTRAYFLEVNEAGDLVHAEETSYDASEDLSEPMKRRALTDTQKAVKVLKGISPENLAEALKALGYV